MLWFFRGLHKGIVTTRYPNAIDPWTQTLPTPPAFHSDRLTLELAQTLVRICPARALTLEESELLVNLGACTGCQLCVQAAGGAAEPSGSFELATWHREELIKRVPVRGGGTRK